MTRYIAKDSVRIYHFPQSLRESWLSFNPQMLVDAFSILPGVLNSVAGYTLRQSQDTMMRKQRTLLLGIPKELVHQNPNNTIRGNTIRGRVGRMRQTGTSSTAVNLMEIDGEKIIDHTIMPKGYTRNLKDNIKINNIERKVLKADRVQLEDSGNEESKGDRSTEEELNRVRTQDIHLNIRKPGEDINYSSTETPVDESYIDSVINSSEQSKSSSE
jgi:hypothetical protein